METKNVTACSMCGKKLKRTSEKYIYYMITDKYWDGVPAESFLTDAVNCKDCDEQVKENMEVLCNAGVRVRFTHGRKIQEFYITAQKK